MVQMRNDCTQGYSYTTSQKMEKVSNPFRYLYWFSKIESPDVLPFLCNTVEQSINIYKGQIHRLPYIATINNFPWAALPNG